MGGLWAEQVVPFQAPTCCNGVRDIAPPPQKQPSTAHARKHDVSLGRICLFSKSGKAPLSRLSAPPTSNTNNCKPGDDEERSIYLGQNHGFDMNATNSQGLFLPPRLPRNLTVNALHLHGPWRGPLRGVPPQVLQGGLRPGGTQLRSSLRLF